MYNHVVEIIAIAGAAVLTVVLIAALQRRARRSRFFHHGDALSLLAIAVLSEGPAALTDELLDRIASHFSLVAPHYATRKNAELILAVLEVCEAVQTAAGVVALTHRGLQMRLNLAKGQPPRGLAETFERKRHGFVLTQAA